MINRSSRLHGRRAIATLMAAAVLASGSAVINAPISYAQTSVIGGSPRGTADGNGAGTFNALTPEVQAGGLLTVGGSGFEQRTVADPFLVFKLNDAALEHNTNQDGSDITEVDGIDAYFAGDNLPDADGNWSATVRLPEDLEPGDYWIRVLGGNDGGPIVSKYVWYKVVEEAAEEPVEDDATVSFGAATTAADTSVTVPVTASGFAADATLTAKVGEETAQFQVERSTADSVTADAEGAFSGTLVLPTGSAPAGVSTTVTISDGTTEASATIETKPVVSFTDSRGTSDTAVGTTVEATVGNLPAGAIVNFIGSGSTNFISAPVSATDATATADSVVIPDQASLVGKSITIRYTVDGTEHTVENVKPITPATNASNVDNFTIEEKKVPAGLYQTAYSAKEDAIYVTRAVGRPPITDSSILKLDAQTLEQEAVAEPGPAESGVNAVYGVGVDDERGYVWVTNTRQNTVAVYKTSDLSLVKQFDAGSSTHSRDVIVDESTGLVYVSIPRGDSGQIDVYDGNTLTQLDSIVLPEVTSTMSLDFNQETGELFTVSLNEPTAVKIDVRDGNKVTYYDLPAGSVESGSGIAFDSKNRNIWIASQGTNNVVVWDADKDKLVKDIPTGAGALNAEYDPVNNLVYVINRGGGNLNVFDADTQEQVGNIPVGGNANHVATDGKGNVYTVNKLNEEVDGVAFNSVFKITPNEVPDDNDDDDDDQDDDKGNGNKGSDKGSNKGSAKGSSNDPIQTGILAALGIGGIAAAIGAFLAQSRVIPAHLIPQPIRGWLNL